MENSMALGFNSEILNEDGDNIVIEDRFFTEMEEEDNAIEDYYERLFYSQFENDDDSPVDGDDDFFCPF